MKSCKHFFVGGTRLEAKIPEHLQVGRCAELVFDIVQRCRFSFGPEKRLDTAGHV